MLRGGTIALYEGDQVTDACSSPAASPRSRRSAARCWPIEAMPPAELSRAEGERRLAEAEAAYDAADKMDVVALEAADGPDAVGARHAGHRRSALTGSAETAPRTTMSSPRCARDDEVLAIFSH